MLKRVYRWRRKLLLGAAALPLLQTTGCDPTGLAIQFGSNIAISLAQQVIGSAISSLSQLLLQAFSGSNLLRMFLGAGS